MLENAFINRPAPPADGDLATALGPAKAVWDEFLAALERDQLANAREWKCHSPKWGWSLRVLQRKRTIVWLSPGRGGFNVAFILGEKAVAAARAARLPQVVAQALNTAPKYPEGTGLRLVVKSARSLGALRRLAAIKAAN